MTDVPPIQGELQAQIMAAVWRLGGGSVDQVRSELPTRYRSAYNTVQTVLNRLAERGMLQRRREGRGLIYEPRMSEAEYLSGTIRRTLAGASSGARQAALANIIGGLDPSELDELTQLAEEAGRQRAKRRS